MNSFISHQNLMSFQPLKLWMVDIIESKKWTVSLPAQPINLCNSGEFWFFKWRKKHIISFNGHIRFRRWNSKNYIPFDPVSFPVHRNSPHFADFLFLEWSFEFDFWFSFATHFKSVWFWERLPQIKRLVNISLTWINIFGILPYTMSRINLPIKTSSTKNLHKSNW